MKKIQYIIILIYILLFFQSTVAYASTESEFDGEGTVASPYLIHNYEELCTFRDLVNSGNSYRNFYFRQTNDIDMNNKNWLPIGNTQNYFMGVYDGNGYCIKNLLILPDEKNEYNGMFRILGGVVANLGIESGTLDGSYCGSIAGASVGENPAIINCYNKATVKGIYSGGIAASFTDGVIAGSWNSGILEGDYRGGIIASGGDVKIYGCYTTNEKAFPDNISSTTSYTVSKDELFSENFLVKLNLGVGIIQFLFANEFNVNVKQWELDSAKSLEYSDYTGYIDFCYFLNYYFLLIILITVIVIYAIKLYHMGKNKFISFYKKDIIAIMLIFACIAIFLDTALIAKGAEYLKIGNAVFIILTNIIFLLAFITIVKQTKWNVKKIVKKDIGFILICVFILILECMQFNIIPKYDACIYYGSFVKAAHLFRIDLFTYVGAFVCWKWAHGVSLLLAPLEFLMPASSICIYLSNIIITFITLGCIYSLVKEFYIDISPICAALSCAIFAFLPYSLGLFTYFSMEWHITYFSIWLIYSVKKKNNILISFCGYLLAFTKITGAVFYAVFLFTVGLFELIDDTEHKKILEKIRNWINIKKIILWTSPIIIFLITFFWGDHLTIQNFYGSYRPDSMISLKDISIINNTLFQTFIFGFRWIFTLSFIFLLIRYRREWRVLITKQNTRLLISLFTSTICVLFLLCIYNSDGECPRYTSIFNVFYLFLFIFFLTLITKRELLRRVAFWGMTMLLLVQTYWTCDPSLMLFSSYKIDTGKKKMYKIATSRDERPGMNLGMSYGEGICVLGDLYTYNLEYSFYDDLLSKMLQDINPSIEDTFYVLDIIDYELHMCGSANRNYKIYWNSRTKKRTYNSYDKDSIYLNERSITSDQLENSSLEENKLPDNFYLIVVDRVDAKRAVNALYSMEYNLNYTRKYENYYGRISIYNFSKS